MAHRLLCQQPEAAMESHLQTAGELTGPAASSGEAPQTPAISKSPRPRKGAVFQANEAANDLDGPGVGRVAEIVAAVPKPYRKRYLAALLGRGGRKAAIAIHCIRCMGWERSAVGGCTARHCELWAFRPRPKRETT